MKVAVLRTYSHSALILALMVLALAFIVDAPAGAQNATGTIRGTVKDPSGGAMVNATVLVGAPDGQTLTATTNHDGFFEMKNLAPGTYKVQALAKGFAVYENDNVQIAAGQAQRLDISLQIETQQEKVTVTDQGAQIDVAPESNAGAVVISGKELDALSDDPDELQNDLQALAGPSAGPNGGQMYIDGFTAGQLPPKSSIREIRINSNPFSSEYDKLGYGRIEIFTKPGTDQWHGQGMVMGNDSGFNTQNPFLAAGREPPYYSTQYNGSVGGPLSKKASMFVSAQRRDINDIQAIDATPFDPTTQTFSTFQQAVPDSMTRTNVSPRLDYQLAKNDTLTLRYQYWRNNEQDQGIGALTLASQAFNSLETEHTVQVGETHVFGSSIVNETRFQYVRDLSSQVPQSSAPTVNVEGYFDGGGNSQGKVEDDESRYEFQNYTSIVHGNHMIKFGARLREFQDTNGSTSQFNSTYIFKTGTAYQITLDNIAGGLAANANGGGAYEYLLTTGVPSASISLFDAGLYIQDDWRLRPNITFSAGLRFESQTDIPDHKDWAPRVGLAWGLARGKNTPKTVIRAGWGVFYDRFQDQYLIQAAHLNGILQQSYVVYSPAFYNATAPVTTLPASSALSTIYKIQPNLRAPRTMQTAVSVERQLTKTMNLSLTYMNSRGVHQLLTNNVNTPEPGTFLTGNPVYPSGAPGNIFQYESEGIFKQNQFIVNYNVRAGQKLTLFTYYTLNYANSDTSGANSFPSNPYNLLEDYGPSTFDVRHRAFVGGNVGLPYGFAVSPFMIASSGTPYSVVLSQDFVGSTVLNQRPALATNPVNRLTVVNTPLGKFDTNLADLGAGETIMPINDFFGPTHFSLNLRISKVFGFGKVSERSGGGGGGGDGHYHGGRGPGGPFGGGGGGPMMGGGGGTNHRYNLTLSVMARNITNYLNLAQPNGTLPVPDLAVCTTSVTNPCNEPPKFFGVSNSLARGPFSSNGAPRLFYLQASFSF